MLRQRLAFLKHFTLAGFAVALLLGAVEVGLRVHHSCTLQASEETQDFHQLMTTSWTSHHALKPLKSTTRRNPDTRLPISIRTNNFGLRGDLVRTPKPDAVFRVLYLGDEAVFAAEFEEAEGFCELIENRLANATGRKVEVINGGVPGYCPLLSFLHFKHQLASLDPDLIVLNVDMSDVADDHYYRRHARINSENVPEICAHPRLENSSQKKKLPGSGLLLVQAFKRQLGLLPADDDRLSDEEDFATEAGRYAWTREEDPRWQVSIEQTFAPIRHLRELALQTSCRIVVTTIPAPWQISKNAMPDPAAREKWGLALHRQYDPQLALAPLSEFLKQQAIAFCDPTATFLADSEPETLFLETAPRLSRRGHQVFANVVADYLRNAGIIGRPASPFAPRDDALSRSERRL